MGSFSPWTKRGWGKNFTVARGDFDDEIEIRIEHGDSGDEITIAVWPGVVAQLNNAIVYMLQAAARHELDTVIEIPNPSSALWSARVTGVRPGRIMLKITDNFYDVVHPVELTRDEANWLMGALMHAVEEMRGQPFRVADEDNPGRAAIVSRSPIEDKDVRIDLRWMIDEPTTHMDLSKEKVRELITSLERMIEDEEN